MAREKQFRVVNAYGARTREPFVQITLGGEFIQVTPTKARQLAGMLLQCAEAAEGDGFVMDFFTNQIGMEQKAAGALLMRFREHRQAAERRGLADLEPVEPFESDKEGGKE